MVVRGVGHLPCAFLRLAAERGGAALRCCRRALGARACLVISDQGPLLFTLGNTAHFWFVVHKHSLEFTICPTWQFVIWRVRCVTPQVLTVNYKQYFQVYVRIKGIVAVSTTSTFLDLASATDPFAMHS